jgi:DNA-binding response OmpR family regulator/predicted regulator of Ras-like GTPase activity (Roadblock/LC7/MglB family)
MPHVLIVEDDPKTLNTLLRAVEDRDRGRTVSTARDAREAAELLARRQVDLLITDHRLPRIDGYGILLQARGHHPGLPALVMAPPQAAAELTARGPLDGIVYLSKPVAVAELCRQVDGLLAQRIRGRIENIGLASFLQVLEMDAKSCTLKVAAGGRSGRLHLRCGQLVGAATEAETGEAAALDIVTWGSVDLALVEPERDTGPAMDRSVRWVLMEGMRLDDERRRGESPAPAAAPPAMPFKARCELLVARALAVEGVLAALVARIDGTLLAAAGAVVEIDLDDSARTAAWLLTREASVAGAVCPDDTVEEVAIETEERIYLVRPAGTLFLSIVLDRRAVTPGLARIVLAPLDAELAIMSHLAPVPAQVTAG